MRKKLNENEKKQPISIKVDPVIYEKLNENFKNKSKYIEHLIYQDMKKNNIITNDLIL
jgi:hypothetical protein